MDIYVVQDYDYAVLGVFNSLPAAHNFVLNYIEHDEKAYHDEPSSQSREFIEAVSINNNGRIGRIYKEGYQIVQFKLNEKIYEV